MEDDVTIVTAVLAAAVMTAGVRAEDEAGEEDHRDYEYDAGDDPDPCGDGAKSGPARFLAHGPG